ncbi:MAG: tyrosine-protein phosphatase [Mogibacterium sp.]|nr:tyrosine-protein phosphatase [Mogibacterium sp.]
MKKIKRTVIALLMAGLLISPVNATLLGGWQVYAAPTERTATEITTTVAGTHPKYGNATLAVTPTEMEEAGYKVGDILKVVAKEQTLEVPFCTNYSDVDSGSLVIINNGSDIIFAINLRNIASTYGLAAGDEVKISLGEAAGYLEEYEIRHLERTNDRDDYSSDEVFANFRPVSTTGMKEGVLYRSSSPVNDEIGRASYADTLISEVDIYYPAADSENNPLKGVQTVINLADTADQILGYTEEAGFNSPYYKSLFESGAVVPLAMGVDFTDPGFGEKLAEGLRFMINHNGPYLVHCNEGKDRAGFVSALLEALVGATHEEVVNDYMTTYENYYHIDKVADASKWNKIADSNIKMTFKTVVAGLDKDADFDSIDLQAATEAYLKNAGLTDDEITRLKICLSDQSGTIQEIEKYGHVSSDIKIADFLAAGYEFGDVVTVTFDNGYTADMPFLDGYYVEKGDMLLRAYPGHETIAVCINYGKFFEEASIVIGDRFTVSMKEKAGYLDEYLVRNLTRTNNREDYSSDEEFANFRKLKYGKTLDNMLYRSASPVNNEIGRAEYADKLMGDAKVKTVVNLADTDELIADYLEDDKYNTPNYAKLVQDGKVKALNLGLAYESPEFKSGIITGLKFMAANQGPYLFHCTEGKDRTGFFGALLNSFVGATKDEIVADYMKSYENFYGVSKEKNSKQYELIANDVLGMLKHIAGTDNLNGVDLQAKAVAYMKSGSMTDAEIAKLKANLMTPDPVIPPVIVNPPVNPPVTPTDPQVGDKVSADGNAYEVSAVAGGAGNGEVKFSGANAGKTVVVPDTVTINGKTYDVTVVGANAFASSKIKNVTIGKNVKKIEKNAFKKSKVKTLTVKTKKLTKASVKSSLKGSKIKTVKVKVGKKKDNKKFVKKYKKIFTKKNAGKKVKVK